MQSGPKVSQQSTCIHRHSHHLLCVVHEFWPRQGWNGLDMCRGGIVDRLDKGCWRWSYQAGGKENTEEVCTVDADEGGCAEGWCNTEGCWDGVRWRQMMILDHDCSAKFYTWSFKTMNINSEIHVWVMQIVSLSMTATSGREQLFSQKWSRQDPPPLLIVRGFHRSPGERQPVYKQSTECSRSQTWWHDLQIMSSSL